MRQKPFKCKRVTCSAPFGSQYQRSETSVCLSCVSRVEWTWKHMNLYTMHIFRIASRVVHPQTDATPRALQLLKSLSSLQFEQESQSVRMYSDFHSILFVKSSRFTIQTIWLWTIYSWRISTKTINLDASQRYLCEIICSDFFSNANTFQTLSMLTSAFVIFIIEIVFTFKRTAWRVKIAYWNNCMEKIPRIIYHSDKKNNCLLFCARICMRFVSIEETSLQFLSVHWSGNTSTVVVCDSYMNETVCIICSRKNA